MSTLPYKLPNFKHDAYRVFTNNPISGAMRGHGVTHTRFAAEIQMEMMAGELGLDPVEVRLKNVVTAPHKTINKVTVDSCGLSEGLEVLADRPEWKKRARKKQAVSQEALHRRTVLWVGHLYDGRRLVERLARREHTERGLPLV